MQKNRTFTRSQGGMQRGRITKYQPFPPIDLPDRQWPSRTITTAPAWCSVDLRDGNQALPIPMSVAKKLEMFKLLVSIGFKEIEIGFPAASQTEFDFTRCLIEEGLIPDDVTVQVLVQAREELIARTFESLYGVKKAILHFYNSTSLLQRRVVFGLEKPDIVGIATRSAQRIKEMIPTLPDSHIILEYSPESFSSTEIEFALEICEAVVDIWQPTRENKIILNLPATVEVSTPNMHADQIEWFCRHLRKRDTALVSLHAHNDRGTGVASTELGLLAGADRVEGTLFGNGERTGNVDIVTLALNMYTQGVDPHLDFSDINAIRAVYEKCTHLEVPMRQPYAGELVFTAFSGSHQDAINKGMMAQDSAPSALWAVPYLPIDPKDIGRTYEAIIRINSQSGKGGVAYIMEAEYGFQLPKAMHVEFGKVIKDLSDERGDEVASAEIFQAFEREYLQRTGPIELKSYHIEKLSERGGVPVVECIVQLTIDGVPRRVNGQGNGPIDAFVRALNQQDLASFGILSYFQHALDQGADATAVAYIQIKDASGRTFFGAATDTDSEYASLKAVVSALNRSL